MKLWRNWGKDCFKIFSSDDRVLGPRIRTQRRRDHGLSMIYGNSLSSLSLASSHSGGKSLFSGRWRSCMCPGQPAQPACPQYYAIRNMHILSMCRGRQWRRTAAWRNIFHEGRGMQSKFHYIPSSNLLFCGYKHMAGEGHVWVNRFKLRAPIYAYMEYAQFVDVSEVNNGGVQQAQ